MINAVSNPRSLLSRLTLVVSIFSGMFWMLVQTVDVYHFAFTGMLYELLWLPELLLIYCLPVFCFILLFREKFKVRSLYFYALLISSTLLFQVIFMRF